MLDNVGRANLRILSKTFIHRRDMAAENQCIAGLPSFLVFALFRLAWCALVRPRSKCHATRSGPVGKASDHERYGEQDRTQICSRTLLDGGTPVPPTLRCVISLAPGEDVWTA